MNMRKSILVLFIIAISLQLGSAANFYYNWFGGNFTTSAGDWYSDAALTVPQAGIPGDNDDVWISAPGLILDANQTFHSLVIEPSGELIFSNGITLTVSNSIIIDGILDGAAGACTLIAGINLTVNSSPNTDFTLGTVNVGGVFTVNTGSTVNLTNTTLPDAEPTGDMAGVTGYTPTPAVPVSPWVIVGFFALIAGAVLVRKRMQIA